MKPATCIAAGKRLATRPYIGRFAPSPSGPLHAGSLVAALASFLDARAHGGRWLLRIEDLDRPRVVPGADRTLMQQLQAFGMHWDGEICWQSQREAAYQRAWTRLQAAGLIYPCACTRREIADSQIGPAAGQSAERPYPGTCRTGLAAGRVPRAWRVRMPAGTLRFHDRWAGVQSQNVAQAVGDFIVRRADGLWAYQLAVVVDDGEAGVTDVVRGADLLASSARQIQLARCLALPTPRYLHVPLVIDAATGLKLSKQNGAPALDAHTPLATLQQAWQQLGFEPLAVRNLDAFWSRALAYWARRWGQAGAIP